MMRRLLLAHAVLIGIGIAGCDDNPPTSPENTTTSIPAGTGEDVSLRAVQLTQDARMVDLVANGQVVAAGVDYQQVSPYSRLRSGDYRLQFFPVGSRAETLVETIATLRSGQVVTVALGGLNAFQIGVVDDDVGTRSDRARVKFLNAVPDFPAPLDVAVRNGPVVFQGATYLKPTSYQELIPGIYDLVLRRGGTTKVLTTSTGHTFDRAASYSVFAVGTLRRDDIELLVVRDR